MQQGHQIEATEKLHKLATTWNGAIEDLDLPTSQLEITRGTTFTMEVAQSLCALRDFIRKACVKLSPVQLREGLASGAANVLSMIKNFEAVNDIDKHNGRNTEMIESTCGQFVEHGTKVLKAKGHFDTAKAGKSYSERILALQDWKLQEAHFLRMHCDSDSLKTLQTFGFVDMQ